MFTKIVLPLIAVAGVVFAINRVVEARRPEPVAQPIVEPPSRPDAVRMIAGSGLVEARRENIPIGVNIPGVVTEVFVKKGETARELWERALAPLGIKLLGEVIDYAKTHKALPAKPQDEQFATKAPSPPE